MSIKTGAHLENVSIVIVGYKQIAATFLVYNRQLTDGTRRWAMDANAVFN